LVERLDFGRPLAPVIVTASTFEFGSQAEIDRYFETGEGYVYSRYGNPTVRQAERLLAQLEGAEDAACFGSGMAAITTLFLTLARSGERVAAQRELYGGAVDFLSRVLPELGIEVLWLGREEIGVLEPSRIAGCRVLYLETPVNPTLRIVDLRRASSAAREAGAIVAVDGTFATPILQRPLELGVDLVVHSATKFLGGHSDLIGGAVSGSSELIEKISLRRRSLGGTMDPFTAFLLYRGMRTLAVRMEAHCRGALEIARYLAGHEKVEEVSYPGLEGHPDRALVESQMEGSGGMVSFTVPDGERGASRVHDSLRLFVKAGSLGGVESLVSIPAKMSHRYMDRQTRETAGVPDGMIRLSVGLETPGALIADLEQALR
jgi:cystathionine beta-lyase/cystathionine gamma-synthase